MLTSTKTPMHNRSFERLVLLCTLLTCLVCISCTYLNNLFSDDDSKLYSQTIQTFNSALTPGTRANRHKQAEYYLTFCVKFNVHYLFPTILNVSMYVQWLANNLSSPSSLKNYLSGAKSWVSEHRGDITSFLSSEVAQMIKSVTKHTKHVVRRAAPIFLSHLSIICSYCDYHLMVPLAVKPCILLGHALYLRASNLVSPSMDVWGGPHTLRVKDVSAFNDKLVVRISSSKTRVKPVVVTVHVNSSSQLCPVRAWTHYVNVVSPPFFGPAFIVQPGRSLTAKLVVTVMRQALTYDSSIDVTQVSMHSLRRGAAQSAASSGMSTDEIMSAGGWASESGLNPYLSN